MTDNDNEERELRLKVKEAIYQEIETWPKAGLKSDPNARAEPSSLRLLREGKLLPIAAPGKKFAWRPVGTQAWVFGMLVAGESHKLMENLGLGSFPRSWDGNLQDLFRLKVGGRQLMAACSKAQKARRWLQWFSADGRLNSELLGQEPFLATSSRPEDNEGAGKYSFVGWYSDARFLFAVYTGASAPMFLPLTRADQKLEEHLNLDQFQPISRQSLVPIWDEWTSTMELLSLGLRAQRAGVELSEAGTARGDDLISLKMLNGSDDTLDRGWHFYYRRERGFRAVEGDLGGDANSGFRCFLAGRAPKHWQGGWLADQAQGKLELFDRSDGCRKIQVDGEVVPFPGKAARMAARSELPFQLVKPGDRILAILGAAGTLWAYWADGYGKGLCLERLADTSEVLDQKWFQKIGRRRLGALALDNSKAYVDLETALRQSARKRLSL